MTTGGREGSSGRRRALWRLLGAWLALTTVLALPGAHAVELHHVDHQGDWLAAEPADTQMVPSQTGTPSEPGCPLCLASGQARTGALAPTGGAPIDPRPVPCQLAGARPVRLPAAADVFAAGPRAPPSA